MMIDIGTSIFCLLLFYMYIKSYNCSILYTVYTIFKLTSCDPLAAFCAPHSPLLLLPGPAENWGRGSGAFHQRDRRREWRYSRVGGLALRLQLESSMQYSGDGSEGTTLLLCPSKI
jgi:hypothetical protein